MSRFFDPRLLRQARPVRRLLVLTVTFGALSGVLIVLAARVLAAVVNGVFLGGLALADVWPLLVALAAIAVVRGLLLWAGDVTANRVATRVKTDLRERLTAHLLALGPAYTRGERTGELVNTAVEGIEALDAYFSQYLPQLALAVLIPVTFLLVVFPLDPLSGLVLLLTAPLIPVFMILIGSLADSLTRQQWTALSRMSAHFLDVLQGLTTLKLFNRSREQIAVIAEISDRYRDTTLGVLRVAFLSALVLEMVGTLSTAIIAVEIGLRVLYGRLAFEQAFFVLILAPEFYLPLRLLGTRFHAGIAGVTAARRVFEVLETPVGDDGDDGDSGDAEREFAASPCHPRRRVVRQHPLRLRQWRPSGVERCVVRDPPRREGRAGGAERRGQEHDRGAASGLHPAHIRRRSRSRQDDLPEDGQLPRLQQRVPASASSHRLGAATALPVQHDRGREHPPGAAGGRAR